MSRPAVLLLDEPSLGLAPRLVREIMQTSRRCACSSASPCCSWSRTSRPPSRSRTGSASRGAAGSCVLRGRPGDAMAHPDVHSAYLGRGYEVTG